MLRLIAASPTSRENTWTSEQTFGEGIFTDAIGEETAAAGVTIDGVLLKDGGGTFTSPVFQADGGITAPSYSFASNVTSGMSVTAGGSLIFQAANSNGARIFFANGQLSPFNAGDSNAIDIGNSSRFWRDLYLAGQAKTGASTTARASLNVPHGTAPTAPVNGDIWTTTAGLFVRINGATVGPLS